MGTEVVGLLKVVGDSDGTDNEPLEGLIDGNTLGTAVEGETLGLELGDVDG